MKSISVCLGMPGSKQRRQRVQIVSDRPGQEDERRDTENPESDNAAQHRGKAERGAQADHHESRELRLVREQ